MYRVKDIVFVEADKAWATALDPDGVSKPLEVGAVLVSGVRRWKVIALYPGPGRVVGAKLEGAALLTQGLIIRPDDEPMGAVEYHAAAILLVRLARAFRNVDLDGVVKFHEAIHAQKLITADAPGVVKTALFAALLVENGATAEELADAAKVLGLDGEF